MRRCLVLLAAAGLCLAAEPAAAAFPGKPGKIAFSRASSANPQANGDIWIASRSGEQRRLTRTRGIDESNPVFSPGGGRIAFVRRTGGDADIWVMRANGTRKREVAGSDLDEFQPSFYPGGGSILFTRFDGSRGWTVMSVRLNGTRPMRQVGNATFPVVSPDGRWLAYTKVQDGRGGIRLRNQRTGRTRALTTGSAQDLDFSPNGRRIAFTGQRRCSAGGTLRFTVLTVGINADRARPLRRSCRREFISPAWSPNGRKIVFAHKRLAGTAAGLRFRLGMMRPDGSPASGAPRHRRGTNELGPAWQPLRRR
jgi:Tol biopolymer transport system component